MPTNTKPLIDQLVADLRPKRYWPPWWRFFTWFSLFATVSILGMIWRSPFRSHFFEQLQTYPLFFIETLSSLTLGGLLIFWFLTSLVPGYKLKTSFKYIISTFGIFFVLSLILSFSSLGPPSSPLGARPHCVFEVLFYGSLGLLSVLFFTLKSDYLQQRKQVLFIGFGLTLIPATLMQMACMYDPVHGLLFHYGPIFVVALLGLLLPVLKSLFQRSNS